MACDNGEIWNSRKLYVDTKKYCGPFSNQIILEREKYLAVTAPVVLGLLVQMIISEQQDIPVFIALRDDNFDRLFFVPRLGSVCDIYLTCLERMTTEWKNMEGGIKRL